MAAYFKESMASRDPDAVVILANRSLASSSTWCDARNEFVCAVKASTYREFKFITDAFQELEGNLSSKRSSIGAGRPRGVLGVSRGLLAFGEP